MREVQGTFDGQAKRVGHFPDLVNLVFPKLPEGDEKTQQVAQPTLGARSQRNQGVFAKGFDCVSVRTRPASNREAVWGTLIFSTLVGGLVYVILGQAESARLLKVPFDGRLPASVGIGLAYGLWTVKEEKEVRHKTKVEQVEAKKKDVEVLKANLKLMIQAVAYQDEDNGVDMPELVRNNGYDNPEAFRKHFMKLFDDYEVRLENWGGKLAELYKPFEDQIDIETWLTPAMVEAEVQDTEEDENVQKPQEEKKIQEEQDVQDANTEENVKDVQEELV